MKTPFLILHGWSKNMTGQRYHELAEILTKKGHTVYTPDLPGFGKNPLSKNALQFEDYLVFVKEYIEKEIKAEKVILFGHSFGGRIAIRFTAQHSSMVAHLILCDASGIPQRLSLKKYVAKVGATTLKPLFTIPPFSFFYPLSRKILYRGIGEMDYYKAGNLSETFKNVYNISVVDDLPHIAVPTLIVWGKNDTFTPLSDGEYMHTHIPDARMAVVADATHKLPYEHPEDTAREIERFLS
jgi:pimeloyl-ACP methyl ester carboxylesterase